LSKIKASTFGHTDRLSKIFASDRGRHNKLLILYSLCIVLANKQLQLKHSEQRLLTEWQ